MTCRRVAASLIVAAIVGGCGSAGPTAADQEDIEGRWDLVSTDLDTTDGSVAAPATSTRFVVIGPDHISGVLGCGDLDATYEYTPPLLRLTERFEYTSGQDEDGPCDVETWNDVLDSDHTVTFPETGVMVWTSGDAELIFESSE